MEKRLVLFLVLAFAMIVGNMLIEDFLKQRFQQAQIAAGPPVADKEKGAGKDKGKEPGKEAGKENGKEKEAVNAEAPPGAGPALRNPAANGNGIVAAEKPIPDQWFTLGSAAPSNPKSNPYQMLVTLTNRGAAVERIELNSPRYHDLENHSGYLGQLDVADAAGTPGARVNVVGTGTPAAAAGIKAADVITSLGQKKIAKAQDLIDELAKTQPDQKIDLVVRRDGQEKKLAATLGNRPLEVVRPEFATDPVDIVTPGGHDPLSLLLTLTKAGDEEMVAGDEEIPGLQLRTGTWQGKQVDQDTVEFTKDLPRYGLKIVKRFSLARIRPAPERPGQDDQPAYDFKLRIEIQNTGSAPQSVAYQLDGPTGLPTEGWWYANRISRDFSGIGLRDVALQFEDNSIQLVSSLEMDKRRLKELDALKEGKSAKDFEPESHAETETGRLLFGGVDAQYFAVILLPRRPDAQPQWLQEIKAIVVGEVPTDMALRKKQDVTCRLTSMVAKLEPGKGLVHEYQVFAGPKQPRLLEQYQAGSDKAVPRIDLSELVYYGWFWWVSKPMLAILEFFYSIVGNYGVAIVMLTVLVRLCMFPLSRKQALGAKKMQDLAPEMKKINEAYKGNPQEKTRATQELWRKHNYNPMGGCLLAFVQLPVLMGLYRSLMVDVELRQAALMGSAVRWCSNLAAPDMFWYWKDFLWPSFASETGYFGPYLNLLPLVTVSLFLWQQKMFMPPPTDDTTAMQQKLMKYMMVFMAFMFFKVASGLCLYFIASSIWGIGERKLLPGMVGSAGKTGAPVPAKPVTTSGGNGSTGSQRRRQRGHR